MAVGAQRLEVGRRVIGVIFVDVIDVELARVLSYKPAAGALGVESDTIRFTLLARVLATLQDSAGLRLWADVLAGSLGRAAPPGGLMPQDRYGAADGARCRLGERINVRQPVAVDAHLQKTPASMSVEVIEAGWGPLAASHGNAHRDPGRGGEARRA